MGSRLVKPDDKLQECFLSGLDSSCALLHAIRAFDPLTGDVDEFYVADFALREVCRPRSHQGRNVTDAHFEIAAQLFRSYKQAESAGYSDVGFVTGLKGEAKRHKWTLFVVTGVTGSGAHMCLMTDPLGEDSGDLRLWCRTATPLPQRVIAAAENHARFIACRPSWTWMHERWMIASSPDPRGNISRAAPPWDATMLVRATLEYGDPPDLFKYLSGSMSLPGYEIIRRMLL